MRGIWHVEGVREPLLTGDAIQPRSLLQPDAKDSAHSIAVLLPDGQQVLYECFTAKDCARGFRVPSLYQAPSPFETEMLARIRAVLVRQRGQTAAKPATQPLGARDEAVTVLGPNNRIELGGLAARLSNGSYFGDLQAVDARHPQHSGIPLEKSGPSIAFTVPGPGLYLLKISDSRNWPRIDFMIAVVSPHNSSIANNFQKERSLLASWNAEYFGWPAHDFQRAYLKSLMLHIPPAPSPSRQAQTPSPSQPDATAEPTFSPQPDVVSGDIAITLHCATPGATIHYSIDTSQPMENSPAYHAPIIVKNMPLTIKAFAESPGKKDSPVVTANYRVKSD
ncbi:MAG TPA: FN3 associated domain-containing protein [Terracidiphilus sp.]|nr:FN3 associated domain-containing protein [Terracidiphilus sp.]